MALNEQYTKGMQALIEGVLASSGDTDPLLRRAIAAKASEHGGSHLDNNTDIPPELTSYIKKVALHAYKTTDEDIETLLQAGYSEDALFEITLSAALGAGLARLECGLSALQGDK